MIDWKIWADRALKICAVAIVIGLISAALAAMLALL